MKCLLLHHLTDITKWEHTPALGGPNTVKHLEYWPSTSWFNWALKYVAKEFQFKSNSPCSWKAFNIRLAETGTSLTMRTLTDSFCQFVEIQDGNREILVPHLHHKCCFEPEAKQRYSPAMLVLSTVSYLELKREHIRKTSYQNLHLRAFVN
jgi:hypothetical protein